jgi:2-amino-4-hydroxy-6-hydroxymethyldihydropteridine diphosphokinase
MLKTPPVGGPSGQGDFLNAIVRIDHHLSVWEVWERIKRIENQLGRQRQRRWESRRIDIDLILHGEQLVWTPHLKVPHPRMSMRTFVIRPACEVGSDLVDPVTGLTIGELSRRLEMLASPRIAVACSSDSLLKQIQAASEQLPSLENQNEIQFWVCSDPTQWWQGAAQVDLHVACVEIPHPENVQWEDYCLSWAKAMGFVDDPFRPRPIEEPATPGLGARYLLPGIDIPWVCHELQAARLALRCPLESSGESWVL